MRDESEGGEDDARSQYISDLGRAEASVRTLLCHIAHDKTDKTDVFLEFVKHLTGADDCLCLSATLKCIHAGPHQPYSPPGARYDTLQGSTRPTTHSSFWVPKTEPIEGRTRYKSSSRPADILRGRRTENSQNEHHRLRVMNKF